MKSSDIKEMFASDGFMVTDSKVYENITPDSLVDHPEWHIISESQAIISIADTAGTDTTQVVIFDFNLNDGDYIDLYNRLSGPVPYRLITFPDTLGVSNEMARIRYKKENQFLFTKSDSLEEVIGKHFKQ